MGNSTGDLISFPNDDKNTYNTFQNSEDEYPKSDDELHKYKPSEVSRTHSINYTLNREKSVSVSYTKDDIIDMVIIDDELDDRGHNRNNETIIDKHSASSTISRFSCRVTASRNPPYTVRLFAGGFDTKNQISLGQYAPKVQRKDQIDGLTTNGVLIKKPGGIWREVSVNGFCHKLRVTRSAFKASARVYEDTNELIDGTLIDLCGCMLIYRDANFVENGMDKNKIITLTEKFNNDKIQCPVRMNTLKINPMRNHTIKRVPKKNGKNLPKLCETWPFVYIKCGHVYSYHDWDKTMNKNESNDTSATGGNLVTTTAENNRSSFIS